MAGKKIPTTMQLTERQTAAIRREAKKNDISDGEQIRRVLDEWIGRQPPGPIQGRIVQERAS